MSECFNKLVRECERGREMLGFYVGTWIMIVHWKHGVQTYPNHKGIASLESYAKKVIRVEIVGSDWCLLIALHFNGC